MAKFLHSVMAQDEAVAANTTVTWNLGVNALSHILLTLRFLNLTTLTKATLANVCAMISKLEVLFRGQSILSLNGIDLFAYVSLVQAMPFNQENVVDTLNAARFATFIIPFGRRLFDPTECFPKVLKGELQLQLTTPAAYTNITTVTAQIETIELPEASPKQYVKATTLTKTPTATGEHDVDLPIGNILLGCLLFSTTVPTGTTFATSIDWLKLLVDNVESHYSRTNWESLHNQLMAQAGPVNAWAEKIHRENLAAAYTQNADTLPEEQVNSDIYQHSLLDLDPTRDGMYSLDTKGKARIHLRINAGDTGAIRVLPLELVRV